MSVNFNPFQNTLSSLIAWIRAAFNKQRNQINALKSRVSVLENKPPSSTSNNSNNDSNNDSNTPVDGENYTLAVISQNKIAITVNNVTHHLDVTRVK